MSNEIKMSFNSFDNSKQKVIINREVIEPVDILLPSIVVKRFLSICNFDSKVQYYECQVIKNGVSFDGCLWQELNFLWQKGIETTGCCCGNHVNSSADSAYIQVKPKYEQNMLDLGYKKRVNEFGLTVFKPKTIIVKRGN